MMMAKNVLLKDPMTCFFIGYYYYIFLEKYITVLRLSNQSASKLSFNFKFLLIFFLTIFSSEYFDKSYEPFLSSCYETSPTIITSSFYIIFKYIKNKNVELLYYYVGYILRQNFSKCIIILFYLFNRIGCNLL